MGIAEEHGRLEADRLHCLQVNLSRWDLFHAHAFRSWRDGKLGLLFHAKEYPQECEAFPYNLGFCQRGSSLEYETRGMDFRNLLLYEVHDAGCPPFISVKSNSQMTPRCIAWVAFYPLTST